MTITCARRASVSDGHCGPAGAVTDQSDCSASVDSICELSIIDFALSGYDSVDRSTLGQPPRRGQTRGERAHLFRAGTMCETDITPPAALRVFAAARCKQPQCGQGDWCEPLPSCSRRWCTS